MGIGIDDPNRRDRNSHKSRPCVRAPGMSWARRVVDIPDMNHAGLARAEHVASAEAGEILDAILARPLVHAFAATFDSAS
eukprot:scaffold889_cov268-Pinguiococcus_pyrenoidosus.AAC.20